MRIAAAITALLIAAPAAAERAVVLPVGGDAELAELAQQATEALAAAAEEQRLEVVRHEPGTPPCDTTACAPALLEAHSVHLVIGAALWRHEGRVTVNVLIITGAGDSYPGEVATMDDAVTGAIAAAFRDARGLQLLGPGPWVHVTATPRQAEVTIDGIARGRAPYRAHLDAGQHELLIQAPGYADHRTALQLPPNPSHLEHVEVELAVAAEPAASASSYSAPGAVSADQVGAVTTWNTVAGLALAATAAALLGAGIYQLTIDGDCDARTAAGNCTHRVDAPASVPLVIGGGASALLSGATFIFTPLEF